MDPSAATASGSVTFIRPLFLCLVHPRDNKAIEVVDISRVPASAQMEFSTLLLLQILIKALTSQQWTHCLGKSKQFLAAFQGPGGPPELGHGAVGSTSALGSPPTPLLQLVELCRVKGNGCFEPGTGSHTEGPHPTVRRRASDGDPLPCCGEEGRPRRARWDSRLPREEGPPGPGPCALALAFAAVVPRPPRSQLGHRVGRDCRSPRAPSAHGVLKAAPQCSQEGYRRRRARGAGLLV